MQNISLTTRDTTAKSAAPMHLVPAQFAPAHEGFRRADSRLSVQPDHDSQLQPQDGVTRSMAAEVHTLQRRVTGKIVAAGDAAAAGSAAVDFRFSKLLSEPEDARLTGGTRSLMRRVLGLNVPKAPRKTQRLRPVRVA